MLKFTDSILMNDNPNGAEQQLSSQDAITYNPTFLEEQQELSNLDVQIRQFLNEIEDAKDDSSSLISYMDTNQRQCSMNQIAKPQVCIQKAHLNQGCSSESKTLNLQNMKQNYSVTHRLYIVTKKFRNHIQRLEAQMIEMKKKIKQNDHSNSKYVLKDQIIGNEQQNIPQKSNEILILSSKLKHCKFQYYKMKEDNNKLFEQIKQIRRKIEAQFQELYKSQIKNLQLELLLQKQRFEYEISQLHQKLNQANQTAASLGRKPIEFLAHDCDISKQQSLISLRQENQQLKGEIEAMKTKVKKISSFSGQIQSTTKIMLEASRVKID